MSKQLDHSASNLLFARAKNAIPGGVNSPVRAFKSVGGTPLFMSSASGAYLYDEDGNKYLDLIASWGPMILGHAHPIVTKAIKRRLKKSTSYGAPTLLEIEMAELIKKMCPGVDKVRMVSSGTEACMSALRLARGYTGKNKLIKLEGHYHGHADPFLVSAGSGLATLNIQTVPGVTAGVSSDTIIAPYNNIEAIRAIIDAHPGEIAALILEPVAGNMGCVLPRENYLKEVRSLCTENNIVLIFDEVMTGFRLAPGGAQEMYGVTADLITYGKVIGGGLPVGAFGGKEDIMNCIAPVGKVYQAGTLSGNPIAMTAGLETLRHLFKNPGIYKSLDEKTSYLHEGLGNVFATNGHQVCINRLGSMISVHFTNKAVTDFTSAAACDTEKFNAFFHHMLQAGFYLPPSAFESWFLNNEISYKALDKLIGAAEGFAKKYKEQ